MRITVKVFPRAKKERVVEEEGTIKVYVKAPPVDGKANKQVIDLLAGHLGMKKSRIAIVRGTTSRVKVVEIDEDN